MRTYIISTFSQKERQPCAELRRSVQAIGDVMRRSRLQWHVHVERNGDAEEDVCEISGGGDCSCRQDEDDLDEHRAADTHLLKVDLWDIHDRKKPVSHSAV